jgi:hypothetical protein
MAVQIRRVATALKQKLQTEIFQYCDPIAPLLLEEVLDTPHHLRNRQ